MVERLAVNQDTVVQFHYSVPFLRSFIMCVNCAGDKFQDQETFFESWRDMMKWFKGLFK